MSKIYGRPIATPINPRKFAGGGFVASDTPPEDTSLLWIDTSDNSGEVGGEAGGSGGGMSEAELKNAINTALAQAKASGEFDGAPGAKGDKGDPGEPGEPGAPGKDGNPGEDYVLTEADKAEIAEMASQMVDVPQGGGGEAEWTLLKSETLAEDVTSLFIKSETPVNEFLLLFEGRVNNAEDSLNAGTEKCNCRPAFNGAISSQILLSGMPFAKRTVNLFSYIHIKRVNKLLLASGTGGGYGFFASDTNGDFSTFRHGAWNDEAGTFNGLYIPVGTSGCYFKSGSVLEVYVR